MYLITVVQRIQYVKTKSDCIAEAEGVYDPNAKKKKKQEEKGECN
jgi:U2 small nuclear ribonucleoprotein B''